MKLLTIILALILTPFLAISQQLYGTGVSYTNGVPTYTPLVAQRASELCFSTTKKMLYKWNRALSRWEPVGGVTEQYGVPVLPPGIGETRLKVDNTTGLLYWWTGSIWLDLVASAAVAADEVRAELADSTTMLRAYVDSKPVPKQRVKPDTTKFATNNATSDLSALTNVLGGRGTVTLVVTKNTGVNANPTLPTISDTILGTKIKVKFYAETVSETIGVFQTDLGFVIGFDGTQYVDSGSPVIISDLEEYTFWPVEDSNGWHWSYTKTSGSAGADGNGIFSGSDSLSQENTIARMAADGSQNFGLGYIPNSPSIGNGNYGILLAPSNYGGLTFFKKSFNTYAGHEIYDEELYSLVNNLASGQSSRFRLRNNRLSFSISESNQADKYWGIELDTTKFEIQRNIAGILRSYNLLPASQYPSTTPNTVNILKWTAGVPTFGPRYESDTIYSDVLVKTGDNSLGIGKFSAFPDYAFEDFGLFISPDYYNEMALLYFKDGNNNSAYVTSSTAGLTAGKRSITGNARAANLSLDQGSFNVQVGNTLINDKWWSVFIDSTQIRIGRNIGGSIQYYNLLPASQRPLITSGAITTLINTGNGTISSPSFLRSQHGVATGTTDGSGDLTVTFAAAMPDATYTMIATVEGTTSYTISVHTKATGTCKVRFFNPATGAAVTATSVTISYEAKDSS